MVFKYIKKNNAEYIFKQAYLKSWKLIFTNSFIIRFSSFIVFCIFDFVYIRSTINKSVYFWLYSVFIRLICFNPIFICFLCIFRPIWFVLKYSLKPYLLHKQLYYFEIFLFLTDFKKKYFYSMLYILYIDFIHYEHFLQAISWIIKYIIICCD